MLRHWSPSQKMKVDMFNLHQSYHDGNLALVMSCKAVICIKLKGRYKRTEYLPHVRDWKWWEVTIYISLGAGTHQKVLKRILYLLHSKGEHLFGFHKFGNHRPLISALHTCSQKAWDQLEIQLDSIKTGDRLPLSTYSVKRGRMMRRGSKSIGPCSRPGTGLHNDGKYLTRLDSKGPQWVPLMSPTKYSDISIFCKSWMGKDLSNPQ